MTTTEAALRDALHLGKRQGDEPSNEADHFIVCGDCGQAIDCRDFGEMFRHEEPGHEARKVQ